MLDLGWSELLVIGIVALIVVGPKDLPRMLRTLGQYAGKARSIARDFQRSMDEAARQADIDELKDVKKGLDEMRAEQHKMQREMSQSFLDKPEKKKAAKAPDAGAAKPEAAPKPATGTKPKAAPRPTAEPAPTPPKAAAEPAPTPPKAAAASGSGSASGA